MTQIVKTIDNLPLDDSLDNLPPDGSLLQLTREQYKEEIKKGTIAVKNTSIDSQSFNIKKYS